MTEQQKSRWSIALALAGLSADEIERILARPFEDVGGVACFEPESA